MSSERVVRPTLVISQKLSLGSCGQQLDFKKLIPELSVELFRIFVVIWGSRLDFGGSGGVAGLATFP